MQIAKLLLKNGIIPIVSLISPFESERVKIKEQLFPFEFKLIYLDVDINVCKKRDPKGLYKRKISNFSGIDSKYEIPSNPDLVLDTKCFSIQSCLEKICKL
jgi:adenylylsulfate kinase-like enzyme